MLLFLLLFPSLLSQPRSVTFYVFKQSKLYPTDLLNVSLPVKKSRVGWRRGKSWLSFFMRGGIGAEAACRSLRKRISTSWKARSASLRERFPSIPTVHGSLSRALYINYFERKRVELAARFKKITVRGRREKPPLTQIRPVRVARYQFPILLLINIIDLRYKAIRDGIHTDVTLFQWFVRVDK